MKDKIFEFIRNLFKKKCKHKNRLMRFEDYQERFIEYDCLDCDEKFYVGMDD